MVLIFLRSLIYNVLFYMLLVFWLIVAIPTFVMPRWAILSIARNWAASSIWFWASENASLSVASEMFAER